MRRHNRFIEQSPGVQCAGSVLTPSRRADEVSFRIQSFAMPFKIVKENNHGQTEVIATFADKEQCYAELKNKGYAYKMVPAYMPEPENDG